MYLSRVLLDMEDWRARRDLGDPYEMHATLMRLVDAGSARPLWRVEEGRNGAPPFVLIQTDVAPDAQVLRGAESRYFVSYEAKRNALFDALAVGERLRFRVRANPTVTRDGKRHGLTREEDQLAWVDRTLTRSGATEVSAAVRGSERRVMGRRRGGRPIVIQDVTFDGVLHVSDAERLRAAIRMGVGHAKALGYGLVTVAR